MQFDEALSYLLGLGHETLTIKLGLANTRVLLQALGNPHNAFPSIQIAGTNGKGSTAAVLNSIAQAAGIRVGLYTSPHLISITERIRIAGREISQSEFAGFTSEVRTCAADLVARGELAALPTFFEQVTAIALLAFRAAGIELAILETGMGGRLDSTTCANAAIVAITPVALDHEQYLGDTLEKIAYEKAAIIRPGVTAIVAPQPEEVRDVILRQSELSNVSPVFDRTEINIDEVSSDGRFCVTFKTPGTTYNRVWLGLRGRHQITNVSLAIRISEAMREQGFAISSEAIIHGIEQAQHPGRLELIPGTPSVLLDGAHNPAGARTLRDYLEQFGRRPLTLVFGAMSDKRLEGIAECLFNIADQLILCEFNNPRAASLETLQSLALEHKGYVASARSTSEAIRLARERTGPSGMICFTGSLYLVGEVRGSLLSEQALGVGN